MRKTTEDIRDEAIVALLQSGVSAAEITTLQVGDIQFPFGKRYCVVEVLDEERTRKDRHLLVTAATRRRLEAYLRRRGYTTVAEPLFVYETAEEFETAVLTCRPPLLAALVVALILTFAAIAIAAITGCSAPIQPGVAVVHLNEYGNGQAVPSASVTGECVGTVSAPAPATISSGDAIPKAANRSSLQGKDGVEQRVERRPAAWSVESGDCQSFSAATCFKKAWARRRGTQLDYQAAFCGDCTAVTMPGSVPFPAGAPIQSHDWSGTGGAVGGETRTRG